MYNVWFTNESDALIRVDSALNTGRRVTILGRSVLTKAIHKCQYNHSIAQETLPLSQLILETQVMPVECNVVVLFLDHYFCQKKI